MRILTSTDRTLVSNSHLSQTRSRLSFKGSQAPASPPLISGTPALQPQPKTPSRPTHLFHITTSANFDKIRADGTLKPHLAEGEDKPLLCTITLDSLLNQWTQAPPRGRSALQKLLSHIAAKSTGIPANRNQFVLLRLTVDPTDQISVRNAYYLTCQKDAAAFKRSEHSLADHLSRPTNEQGMYEFNLHHPVPLSRISVFAQAPVHAFNFAPWELASMTQDGADILDAYGVGMPGIPIQNPQSLLKRLLNETTVRPEYWPEWRSAALKAKGSGLHLDTTG